MVSFKRGAGVPAFAPPPTVKSHRVMVSLEQVASLEAMPWIAVWRSGEFLQPFGCVLPPSNCQISSCDGQFQAGGAPDFAPPPTVKSHRVIVRFERGRSLLPPHLAQSNLIVLLSGPPPWTRHVGGLANVFNILRGAPCASVRLKTDLLPNMAIERSAALGPPCWSRQILSCDGQLQAGRVPGTKALDSMPQVLGFIAWDQRPLSSRNNRATCRTDLANHEFAWVRCDLVARMRPAWSHWMIWRSHPGTKALDSTAVKDAAGH